MVGPAERPPDVIALADALGALAYPVRLELLAMLRLPRVLSELRLPAHRTGRSPERREHLASRPAVVRHLRKLEDVDLVRREQVEEGGRKKNRYLVNALRLYDVAEELRRLCVLQAGRGPAGEATGTLDADRVASPPEGPRLVLVHGLYEGKAFPLAAVKGRGRWVIGRRKGLPITLDYDPYVSLENAAVIASQGAFSLADLPGSKNGTYLNWSRLPPGGSRVLRPGDVVGVGRSLLCFAPG